MFALAAVYIAALNSTPLHAGNDVEQLRQQLQALKDEYQRRIEALEAGVRAAEEEARQARIEAEKVASATQSAAASQPTGSENSFNPALSVILDGRYAAFDNDPSDYELPGFPLGGEAGLGEEGIGLGHTELTASANVDDKFYGQMTVALHEHEGATEVELEEAFIETLGLGGGLTLRAGRFFSAIGYVNEQHEHAWDFADAPLIYRGLFGNHLRDDGMRLSYVAPTDTYIQLGAEALRGSRFPGGGEQDGIGLWTAFAHIGGDIDIEQSWQLGLSHWEADVDGRSTGGHGHSHDHGDEHDEAPIFTFSGDSTGNALDLVYKWAPKGNFTDRNLKLQFEYFDRQEEGSLSHVHDGDLHVAEFDGDQRGWYVQGIYQFQPQWRTGLRYDRLDSDNRASNETMLEHPGLDDEGHTPERYSAMLEWLPSEFSRVRLQYNRDKSYAERDDQFFLQYTHSLGSHGAHQY